MENPIKMDDLGVPLFSETPIYLPDMKIWSLIVGKGVVLEGWFF